MLIVKFDKMFYRVCGGYENELEVWRPWIFFGGTDTNLMEEREFLLDARFTELNVALSYARYIYLLWRFVRASL